MLSTRGLSTLVTGLFYVFFRDPIEAAFQSPRILVFTFTATALLLLSTGAFRDKQKTALSGKSLWVPVLAGLLQGMAIMPGISRSGATISILLIMGVRRKEAAYYSFFLAIPAIAGAAVVKSLEADSLRFLTDHLLLMTACLVISASFSYVCLRVLTRILERGRFWIFSLYVFGMALVSFWLYYVRGIVS